MGLMIIGITYKWVAGFERNLDNFFLIKWINTHPRLWFSFFIFLLTLALLQPYLPRMVDRISGITYGEFGLTLNEKVASSNGGDKGSQKANFQFYDRPRLLTSHNIKSLINRGILFAEMESLQLKKTGKL